MSQDPAQITLRVAPGVLGRIKRVAAARSLPYHCLARSWIMDGLRDPTTPRPIGTLGGPLTEQLNIKLDRTVLDELKARSDEVGRRYHRLGREWVEAALGREEERLGLDLTCGEEPALERAAALPGAPPAGLGSDEQRILRFLDGTPVLLEALAARSGLPVPVAAAVLARLELRGLATRHPGSRFARDVGG